jgi:hypothetical protein
VSIGGVRIVSDKLYKTFILATHSVVQQDEQKQLEKEVAKISRENTRKFWEADPPFKNFRAHPAGNGIFVSGSSQPTPQALAYLATQKHVGIDVDLREEPHGYIKTQKDNFVSVSRTNYGNWPNPGIKRKILMKKEEKILKKAEKMGNIELVINDASKAVIPHKKIIQKPKGIPTKVLEAETEKEAIEALNKARTAEHLPEMEYYRVPITDELPPTPHSVDQLVKLYQHAKASGKNIHFHCEAGRGRTTTAMVLTRIMDGLSVEDALNYESNANILNGLGKDLREIKAHELLQPVLVKAAALRLGILFRFHDYWNSPQREKVSFEDYMKEHPMDNNFMKKMASMLKIIPSNSVHIIFQDKIKKIRETGRFFMNKN